MTHADFLDSWSEDQQERVRFERQREWDEWLHELELRDETESVECEEAVWAHRFQVWADTREPAHHAEDKPGIDSRCFGP